MSQMSSKVSRIEPIFGWLELNGGPGWHERLLDRAAGLTGITPPGPVEEVHYRVEIEVPASPERLAWMIDNAHRLTPRDGRRWREYERRVTKHPKRDETRRRLQQGICTGIPRDLVLEGSTCSDCLIVCRHLVIWVEGKRDDWLDTACTWDVMRDQLARNVEAAWLYAAPRDKDYCMLLCYEDHLKYHEQLLVDGYRAGTWQGGWPHLDDERRREFRGRIGTLRWATLAGEWPAIRQLTGLGDLAIE